MFVLGTSRTLSLHVVQHAVLPRQSAEFFVDSTHYEDLNNSCENARVVLRIGWAFTLNLLLRESPSEPVRASVDSETRMQAGLGILEERTAAIAFLIEGDRIVHASGPLREVLGMTRDACIGADLEELLAACAPTVEPILIDTCSYSTRIQDRELELLLLYFLTAHS